MDTILVGLVALVVGMLIGRLSIRSWRSAGGGQIPFHGDLVQVPQWVLTAVFAIFTVEEKDATILVGRLRERGIEPTPAQIQAAAQALEHAFGRWLATDDGQTWAARHAPHLLDD